MFGASSSPRGANMWKEFRAFLVKDNIIGLAIAVILGLALNKLVTSFVDDLIMPLVNLATAASGGNWKEWYVPLTSAGAEGPKLLIGNIIGNVINFLVIGLVCFFFAKAFVKPKPA